MPENGNQMAKQEWPPDWNEPRPHKLPRPTYWPAVLAFGIVLIAWGPVTSIAIALIGIVVSVMAIAGWIGELRHES